MYNNMFFSFGEFDKHLEIINQKLSNTDNPPPLEELLIEDGIIEELQNKNEKLIKYLTKEKIKQMIDYIIKEPKEEDHNKGHKFPFVCSKLFNVEEAKIMKYFFKTNKELLNEKDDNENFNKKNINKDVYFDLNQDDKVNIEERYDNFNNFKEKEINIDDINFNDKKDENNEDNDDVVINDVINFDNNNHNDENEDEDMVNLDNENNNEENKNDDINKNEEKDKQEKINTDNKENDDKNKEICLLKTPDTINNNSSKNNRYDISSTQTQEKKEEKKEDNKASNKSDKNDDDNKQVDEELKYPEDKIEILDYLFSFLIDDSELNYVLCGYFSSLMTNLFNINYISIVKYLFTKRKDILKRFVYHSYRKSIAEALCKIIKYEDKFNEEINKNDYDQKEFSIIRMQIIKDIFEKIEINMETEKLYSISFIINDLIESKKIFDLMVNNKSIINSLINKQLNNINLIKKENEKDEIIFNNKKNNFIIIIDIIINWLNNINIHDMQMPMLLYEVNDDFNDEDDLVQQGDNDNAIPELHHTTLSQALFDILPNLIKTNFNKINQNTDNNVNNEENFMIQSYNDYKLKPLGLYKIKIVDLLTSLITYCKNIPNELDNLLINSNFFENAFNYIFEYQWNNLYQESFFQLLKTLLSYNKDYPYHEISADYLFAKMIILNTIMTSLNSINKNNTNENEGNTGNGYTAFLVSLSYKINALIGGNYINLNKSYTREGSMTFRHKGEMGKNSAMDLFYNLNHININININNKFDKNEQDKEEIKPINYIQKYCNEEWNNFFSNNIINKIKTYEEKLCQSNNKNDDDLFMNSFDNDVDINNNINKNKDEELFDDNININSNINSNNKYEEDDDLVINDINEISVNNNKNVNKNLQSTDMEINLNDFLFVDDTENKNKNKDENINEKSNNDNTNYNDNNNNTNINKENENEEKNSIDNTYNTVNFWKQTLEKENNSYINNLGEEALNELSE